MNDSDIPILKKAYDLYRTFHTYRRVVPKVERFTLYERCENAILDMIEAILEAGYSRSGQKALVLEHTSVKLNIARFFIRLLKETRAIDVKKYAVLQEMVDEIGRMLGGWIRSTGAR